MILGSYECFKITKAKHQEPKNEIQNSKNTKSKKTILLFVILDFLGSCDL
jgi:hypothetical protein